MNIKTLSFLFQGISCLVFVRRISRGRHITIGELFHDITIRMGNAAGVVFDIDSHPPYNNRTFMAFVWQKTFGILGYSV